MVRMERRVAERCVCACSVPPLIYELASVTVEEGQVARLICLSHGDPSPDLTLHRAQYTGVNNIPTDVCTDSDGIILRQHACSRD